MNVSFTQRKTDGTIYINNVELSLKLSFCFSDDEKLHKDTESKSTEENVKWN